MFYWLFTDVPGDGLGNTMSNCDSNKTDHVLSDDDLVLLHTVGRRNFLMYSGALAAALCLGVFSPSGSIADSGTKKLQFLPSILSIQM